MTRYQATRGRETDCVQHQTCGELIEHGGESAAVSEDRSGGHFEVSPDGLAVVVAVLAPSFGQGVYKEESASTGRVRAGLLEAGGLWVVVGDGDLDVVAVGDQKDLDVLAAELGGVAREFAGDESDIGHTAMGVVLGGDPPGGELVVTNVRLAETDGGCTPAVPLFLPQILGQELLDCLSSPRRRPRGVLVRRTRSADAPVERTNSSVVPSAQCHPQFPPAASQLAQ